MRRALGVVLNRVIDWAVGLYLRLRESDGRSVVDPLCRCGHPKDTHFRGGWACLHQTDEMFWACGCEGYRP